MDILLPIAKALSDPNRLRVLMALRGEERCACDLIAMLGLAQATVSRHMSLLVATGLVIGRKDGRWTYYRLPGRNDKPSQVVKDAIKWVHTHLENSQEAKLDSKALACHCSAANCNLEQE